MLKTRTDNTLTLMKIGMVSNVLECYECMVYAFLAPVMGRLFLQATEPGLALIQAYTLFTVSYLARPLGSLLLGSMAYKFGRSHSLQVSLIMMSIPTALIGMLPSYSQIGPWATIAFLILRFIQGLSIGGELPLNACYIYESAQKSNRSFLCSTVCASSTAGIFLGSYLMSILFWWFDQETILQWAWRLPYLLGVPITFWISTIRESMREPAAFVNSAKEARDINTKQPLSRLSDNHLMTLFKVTILGGFMQVCSYLLFVWMPTYLIYFVKIKPTVAQSCNTIGLVFFAAFILSSGYLSGFVGYKRLFVLHTLAIITLVIPLYIGLQSQSYAILLSIHILFAWLQSGVPAVINEILGDAFPQHLRALGMSLGTTLPATFLGAPSILLCTYVIQKTGWILFPAFYIMAFGIIALPFALRLNPKQEIHE